MYRKFVFNFYYFQKFEDDIWNKSSKRQTLDFSARMQCHLKYPRSPEQFKYAPKLKLSQTAECLNLVSAINHHKRIIRTNF